MTFDGVAASEDDLRISRRRRKPPAAVCRAGTGWEPAKNRGWRTAALRRRADGLDAEAVEIEAAERIEEAAAGMETTDRRAAGGWKKPGWCFDGYDRRGRENENPGGGDGLPRDQDDGRRRWWTDGDRPPRGMGWTRRTKKPAILGDGDEDGTGAAADEKTGRSGRRKEVETATDGKKQKIPARREVDSPEDRSGSGVERAPGAGLRPSPASRAHTARLAAAAVAAAGFPGW